MRIAHLALDLGPWHQRRHRVHHHHIHRAAAHQHLDDLQRLLAGVGLRDQQFVDIDAQPLGIGGIERVLGVDNGADAAAPLRIGDDMQAERRFAGALRPIDLGDAPARDAADAQRQIEHDRAGRDGFDFDMRPVLAELHDGAFAEAALDLRHRQLQRLLALAGACAIGQRGGGVAAAICRHACSSFTRPALHMAGASFFRRGKKLVQDCGERVSPDVFGVS